MITYYRFPSNQKHALIHCNVWWPGAFPYTICVLLDTVKIAFERDFGTDHVNNRPLTVIYDTDYPSSFAANNLIALTATNGYFSQYAYQFSHELCHVLIGANNRANEKMLWFEETLCELASIYFMERMSVLWTIGGQYFSDLTLKQFAPNHLNYISEHIQPTAEVFDITRIGRGDLLAHFCANPTDRAKNKHMAINLWPTFKKYPHLWAATPLTVALSPDLPLDRWMREWRSTAPESCFNGITEVATVFGLTL